MYFIKKGSVHMFNALPNRFWMYQLVLFLVHIKMEKFV